MSFLCTIYNDSCIIRIYQLRGGNEMLEDLLDELEFKGHEYKIENGWFQNDLRKSFIWFRITDEYEIGELLYVI